MTTWPDKPFIRIIRGREYGEPIDGSLAVREDPGGEYFLVSGPRAKKYRRPCLHPDRLGPYIRRALREGFTVEVPELGDDRRGVF